MSLDFNTEDDDYSDEYEEFGLTDYHSNNRNYDDEDTYSIDDGEIECPEIDDDYIDSVVSKTEYSIEKTEEKQEEIVNEAEPERELVREQVLNEIRNSCEPGAAFNISYVNELVAEKIDILDDCKQKQFLEKQITSRSDQAYHRPSYHAKKGIKSTFTESPEDWILGGLDDKEYPEYPISASLFDMSARNITLGSLKL